MKLKTTILVVAFPIFLLLLSSQLLIFNSTVYDLLLELSDAHSEAKEYKTKTLDYLTYQTNFIQGFSQEENNHMFEVRDKMMLLSAVFVLLLLIYVFTINKSILFYGSLLNLFVVFLILVLPFNFLFIKFHEILFTGTWQFPADSLMIKVFNGTFFFFFFLHIIGLSSILSIIGLVYSRKLYKSRSLKEV